MFESIFHIQAHLHIYNLPIHCTNTRHRFVHIFVEIGINEINLNNCTACILLFCRFSSVCLYFASMTIYWKQTFAQPPGNSSVMHMFLAVGKQSPQWSTFYFNIKQLNSNLHYLKTNLCQKKWILCKLLSRLVLLNNTVT